MRGYLFFLYKWLEGELLGTTEDGSGARIRLEQDEEVVVQLENVKNAHLVYEWS